MTARETLRLACVAGASAALAGLVSLTSPMRRLELWAGDVQARLATAPQRFDDAVIVAIDDESIARLKPVIGNWPYDRWLFARITDYLTRAGARAIVFDILFADERPGDAPFAESLQRGAPATLAAVAAPYAMPGVAARDRLAALGWAVDGFRGAARSWQDVELPLPQLTAHARIGLANVVPDEDGVIRRIALLQQVGDVWMPALPLAAVFREPSRPRVHVESGVLRAEGRSWPIDRQGAVQLFLPSTPHALLHVPFHRVTAAAIDDRMDDETRALFRDRTVFIGATALLIGDASETPMGRLPGVALLAQAYVSLEHGLVLEPRRWSWNGLLLFVALMLPALARARRPDSIGILTLATVAGLTICWAVNWLLLVTARQPTSLVLAMLAGGVTFVLFLTEKIRALRAVRQRLANERLAAERAAALKGEFLIHVSHELRTPLTAILGFSGMLADDPELDAEKRTLAQVARRNAEQLLWHVNNLLDQARITAGQMLIDPRPTSMAEVMDHAVATLSGVPRRVGVELRCTRHTRVPTRVTIDGQRLQQIIINLAANALKFTERGAVHIAADWEHDWLEIRVEDTGSGIPPDALDRIFEPFEQSGLAARRSGTGLGLTISRNLARLMGGELSVTSTIGIGSTFRLRVPAPAAAAVDITPAPANPILADANQGRLDAVDGKPQAATVALRAVVADDSEDIRALLRVFLRRMGLEVSLVEHGQLAVDLALAEQPQLVLLDVQMPVMTGLEAAQALRRAGFSNLVVALTAGSGEALGSELLAGGFDAVVFKPVTANELSSVITRLLAERRNAMAASPLANTAGP